MAGTYTSTGTISNLTRLELEQLRKADFGVGGKGLTVGDSGLTPEGVVGIGSINAEPYTSGPTLALEQVITLQPPATPGTGLGSISSQPNDDADFAWYGPTLIRGGSGTATGTAAFTDTSVDFVSWGVLVGDYLLIKKNTVGEGSNTNTYAVASISVVATNVLTLTNVIRPSGATALTVDATACNYVIVRPDVVQLFAVPGSGPVGREQTFLTVAAGSSLHNTVAPTLDAINTDRVRDLIPPAFAGGAAVDRADAVFGPPQYSGPRLSLEKVGYRIVLYQSNATGTGPNLAAPIASLSPSIDSTITSTDQRMTVDYKAGIIRFSCAPRGGDDIKPVGGNGGVNTTTGRLQLYAVFWAFEPNSLARRNAEGLYGLASTDDTFRTPGRVRWVAADNTWYIGSTDGVNDLAVTTVNSGSSRYAQVGASIFAGGSTSKTIGLRARNYEAILTGTGTGSIVSSDLGGFSVTGSVDFVKAGVQSGDLLFVPSLDPLDTFVINKVSAQQLTLAFVGNPGSGSFTIYRRRNLLHWLPANEESSVSGTPWDDPTVTLPMADKTHYTVGDTTSPPQHPASDYNAISSGFAQAGLRNATEAVNSALLSAAYAGYGTVHLRRGFFNFTSYNSNPNFSTIVIPPGVVVEGEGPSTILQQFAHEFATPSLFKFGPNTGWGVYDPSYSLSLSQDTSAVAVSPTTFSFANGASTSSAVLGYDITWNRARRVWGIFIADGSTNSIWFNEMRPDGSLVLASNLNVKVESGSLLYDQTGAYGALHTPGHYPRAEHVPELDTYVFTYVIRHNPGGGNGPCVCVQAIDYNPAGTTDAAKYPLYWTAGTASLHFTDGSYPYSDHPSIAVTNVRDSSGPKFRIGLTHWALPTTGSTLTGGAVRTHRFLKQSSPSYTTRTHSITGYCTSTDTAWSGNVSSSGAVDFLCAWCVRRHPPYSGTNGTVANSGSPDHTIFSDGAFANWGTVGVDIGSRFLYLADGNAADRGRSGVVTANLSASTLAVSMDLLSNSDILFAESAPASGIDWILYGRSTIYAVGEGTGSPSPVVVAGFTTASTVPGDDNFYDNEREPDYVRVCRGGTPHNFIVVYQTFDTNAKLARSRIPHFEEDNVGYPTYVEMVSGGTTTLDTTAAYREHISTCFCLVNTSSITVSVTFPTHPQVGTSTTNTMMRSMGSRDSLLPYPSGSATAERILPDIAARNYYMTAGNPAMIPDVAWSGSDWVVVSPAVPGVISKTGTYLLDGGNHYLVDSTFVFGTGAVGANSRSYLPTTVETGVTGSIIFNTSPESSAQILAVSSEHCVQISAAPTGVSTGQKVEWMLNDVNQLVSRNRKTPGFRVSDRGEVIVSSSYMTHALEQTNRKQEIINKQAFFGGLTTYTGDSGVLGQTHFTWNDFLDAPRLVGDLGFQGVCVGAPKRNVFKFLGEAAEYHPQVAIAFGENFYGFLDLEQWGTSSTRNRLVRAFRQSFGPWRSGLRNLAIQGTSSEATIDELPLSRQHVWTRHGGAGCANPYFGTDGFRNVYLHFGITHFFGDVRYQDRQPGSLCAVITDSTGKYPIRRRLFTQTAGLVARQPLGGSVTTDRVNSPHACRVVWAGDRFVAVVVTERKLLFLSVAEQEDAFFSDTTNNDGNNAPTLLGFANLDFGFAGDETGPRSNSSVYTPTLETASYNRRFYNGVDAVVSDVAWSGKTLAVVWQTGHNSATTNRLFTSTVMGVTFFNPTMPIGQSALAANVNCHTFVLFTDDAPAGQGYHGPRIIWDGSRFVISMLDGTNPNLNVGLLDFPEDGFASKFQVSAAAPITPDDLVSTADDNAYIGSIVTGTGVFQLADPSIKVNRGDLVFIFRLGSTNPDWTQNATTGGNPNDASEWVSEESGTAPNDHQTARTFNNWTGVYKVRSVNYKTYEVDLGVNFQRGPDAGSSRVYGMILNGTGMTPSLTGNSDFGNLGGSLNPMTSGHTLLPKITGDAGVTFLNHLGLFYNQRKKEYVYINTLASNAVVIAAIKRVGFEIGRSLQVTSNLTNPKAIAAAWNGHHYCVLFISTATTTPNPSPPQLVLLDENFALIKRINLTEPFGTNANQIPGPGYTVYGATSSQLPGLPSYEAGHVVWNPVKACWVISVSAKWQDDTNTETTGDNTQRGSILIGLGNISSYANTTFTLSGAASLQPASRFVLNNEGFTTTGGLTTQTNVDTPSVGQVGYILGNTLNIPYKGGLTLTFNNPSFGGNAQAGSKVEILTSGTPTLVGFLNSVTTDSPYTRLHMTGTWGVYADIPSGSHTYRVHAPNPPLGVFNVVDGLNAGTALVTNVNKSSVDGSVTSDVLTGASSFSLPREDVITWTVGPRGHSVAVQDADGVVIDNVTFNGGAGDISVTMDRMAKPLWRVNGMSYGIATPGGGIAVPVANTRSTPAFPSPVGVVRMPRITNINSSAHSKLSKEALKLIDGENK